MFSHQAAIASIYGIVFLFKSMKPSMPPVPVSELELFHRLNVLNLLVISKSNAKK